MNINVYWGNSDRSLLHVDLIGRWTWEEAAKAIEHMNQLIATVQRPVNIIVNFLDSFWIPNGALIHIRSLYQQLFKNYDKVIWVSNNEFIQFIFHSLTRINPNMRRDFVLVKSLEQANRVSHPVFALV